MGVIFYLSHQPATESAALSGGITQWVLNFLESKLPLIYDFLEIEALHHFIRKYAHFVAYFILGIFTMYPLHMGKIKKTHWIAFGICVAFAISDEIHQLFIPGRAGQIKDVFIDSSGALTGILGYIGVLKYYKRNKSKSIKRMLYE